MEIVLKICLIFIAFALGLFIAKFIEFKTRGYSMSFREALDLTDLPIITFRQGKEKFNLILDTGSSGSVIIPSALEFLNHSKLENGGTIMGMEGNVQSVEHVDIEFFNNSNTYTETFSIVDMSDAFNIIKESHGVTIHGVLGNSFFSKYEFVINYSDLVAYGKAI